MKDFDDSFTHSKVTEKTTNTNVWGCFMGMRSPEFFENKNWLWQNITRTLAIICHEGMVKIHSVVQKLQPKHHKNNFFGGVLGVWGHGGFSKIKISYGKTFLARWQSYAMKELWRLSHSVKSYSQNTIRTNKFGGVLGVWGHGGFSKIKISYGNAFLARWQSYTMTKKLRVIIDTSVLC